MVDQNKTDNALTPSVAAPKAVGSGVWLEVFDDVAVITIDLPGESLNKITSGVRAGMLAAFNEIEKEHTILGAVLISGKPDNFMAGADIEEFLTLKTAGEAEQLSREGQALIDHFEKSRLPFVAAINGACLGGGLESVLACTWRIATNNPKTILGAPEVQLGLIPGAGGTQRLPRLVGLQAALDMILRGKNVRIRQAQKIGLVDEVVHPSILKSIAIARAREFGRGERKYPDRKGVAPGALNSMLEGNSLGRSIVLKRAKEMAEGQSRGNYPAPLAAIDAISTGYEKGISAGYLEEARLFGELAMTEVSRQLISVFFATNAVKRDSGLPAGAAASPLPIRKVGVLGAGFMGSGIATVAVEAGTPVRMKDADNERLARGIASLDKVVREKLTRRFITRAGFADTMSLLTTTTDYQGFEDVDLVIEAVFEDLNVKHQVLREAEELLPAHAIFATNTSTIPIARIAEGSMRPERVIGMHFFSPVHKMPLLEVIVTPFTAPDVIATVVSYGKRIGKTVVVVNDGPGFFVNRILTPYLNESGRMVEEGIPVEDIDAAMVQFGFPVGPLTLLDEVGLDVGAKAGEIIHEALGDRFAPPKGFKKILEDGRLGRKAKRGFYLYGEDGKKGAVDPSIYDVLGRGAPSSRPEDATATENIQKRTVYAMLNEAARCLEDGIIKAPTDGDVAAIYGIGFPPFRGGPFRYIDHIGPKNLVNALEDLNSVHPGRFQPADILMEMARSGARFYSNS